jgi:hypothetical protein
VRMCRAGTCQADYFLKGTSNFGCGPKLVWFFSSFLSTILFKMPLVSRADCHEADWWNMLEVYTENGEIRVTQKVQIFHRMCKGIDGSKIGDFASHYDLLVEQGRATKEEREILGQTIVGDGGCKAAIDTFLAR